MVAKSPEARYQTVAEVIAELESCVVMDLSTPSVSSQRSESSRFSSLIRQTRESSPVTEMLTSPPVTRTRAESTPTIAVNSSEVGTDPKTIAPLVRVKPSGKIAARQRRASVPPWVKYVAAGLLPLLLLAGVIVLIRHKDGTVTKIELPEGATAEIIDTPKDSPRMPAKGVGKVEPNSQTATIVATLPPLAGYGSLVPRPAVIPGLKSWDLVRAMPAGNCFGAELLPDGRIVTTWNTPGIYVHGADLRVEQVFEPSESNGTFGLTISEDGRFVAAYFSDHAQGHHQLSVLELASGRSTPVPGAGWLDQPSLAFNRNRTMIAAGTGSGPKIFPLQENEPPLSASAASNVKPRTVAWSPDESEIWTVDDANAFKAYRSADLTPLPDHPLAKESVAWLNVDGTLRGCE